MPRCTSTNLPNWLSDEMVEYDINELSKSKILAVLFEHHDISDAVAFNTLVSNEGGLIQLFNDLSDDYTHKSLCEYDTTILREYPESDYNVVDLLDEYGFGLDQINIPEVSDNDTINFGNTTEHGFYTLEQVYAIMDDLVYKYDYINYVVTSSHPDEPGVIGKTEGYIGDLDNDGNYTGSFEPQDIIAISITTSDLADLPQTLMTGMHHAREPMSFMSIIYYMLNLVAGKEDDDPLVNALLEKRELIIVPIVNPDGYKFGETNSGGQRKNMQVFDNTFFNGSTDPDNEPYEIVCGGYGQGVDLNRNYTYPEGPNEYFDALALQDFLDCYNADGIDGIDQLMCIYEFEPVNGSSGYPCMLTYHGMAAFSENETQAVRDFIYAEGNDFGIALNFHSFSNLLIHPDPEVPGFSQSMEVYAKLAAEMTRYNEYEIGTDVETVGYEARGDAVQYMARCELLGDGNSDGALDVTDIVFGVNRILDDNYAACLDINSDNSIDILDLIILVNSILNNDEITQSSIFAFTPEVGSWDDGFWPSQYCEADETHCPDGGCSHIRLLSEETLYMNFAAHGMTGAWMTVTEAAYTSNTSSLEFKINNIGLLDAQDVRIKINGIAIEQAMIVEENAPSVSLQVDNEGAFLLGDIAPNDSLDVIFFMQDQPTNAGLSFSLQIENNSLPNYWATNDYQLDCSDTDCSLQDLGRNFDENDDVNLL